MDARRFGPPWPCYVLACEEGERADDVSAVVIERWDRSDEGEIYFWCGRCQSVWWPDGDAGPRCKHLEAVRDARRAAHLDPPGLLD